ncbi:MAG: PAS domain S-box protein [Promethearchaeota archaeon]
MKCLVQTTTPAFIRELTEIYKEELAIEKQDDKDLNRSRRIEIQQIHKNGNIIDVEISTTFLRDDDNNAIGIIGLSRDISARKKAERKLKESEERYRFLFETSPFSIILINSKGKIEDCNSKVEDFGYLREELIGKKYSRLNIIRQKFIPILLERLKNILKGELLPPIDVEFNKKDGSTFWGSINSSLITIAGTKFIQVLVENSTTRIEAEQSLRVSEERLRLITENANDVIWTVDMNLKFTYISPTCIKILGYTDKESVNLSFQKFTTPDSIGVLIEAFKEEMDLEKRGTENKDRVRKIEIQQIHKNGSIVDIELIITWLRDENDKAVGLIGITRDISERKEAERKLKESKEKYRKLFENAPDGISLLDSKGYIVNCNLTDQKLIGFDYDEIIGKHTTTFFKEEYKTVFRKNFPLLQRDGNVEAEIKLIRKDGNTISIWRKGTAIYDENRNFKGAITHSRDITERKLIEIKLKESEKKYRKAYNRANYYKDLFAHDINNILQTINSSAELIRHYLSDSEKNKDVNAISKIINKQVMRGAKLINNIHTLSNLENQDITVEPIKINNLLKNSIEYIKKVYIDRDINIQIHSPNEDFMVQANFLVQQAFDNILNNAVKYNSNENLEISIGISKTIIEDIKYIKMEFKDNGIGVADERKDVIFKKYEREHKGGKGMGVGLSLVKKIIKKYNGKIWVEDKVKGDYTKGSNFIILIPEAVDVN